MRSGPLRSVVAACLLVLTGVLATGLPSHHHESAGGSLAAGDAPLITADRHAHATQLVEGDDRVPAGPLQSVVLPVVSADPAAAAETWVVAYEKEAARPTGRAPPLHAARAPPHRI